MSLLPIIYNSLLLFSGLAFVIITISFLLSKFNNRENEVNQIDLQPTLSKNLRETIINKTPYHTYNGYDKLEKGTTQVDKLVSKESSFYINGKKVRKEMTDYEIMSYYLG